MPDWNAHYLSSILEYCEPGIRKPVLLLVYMITHCKTKGLSKTTKDMTIETAFLMVVTVTATVAPNMRTRVSTA